MKLAHRKRANRSGVLILVAGMLLVLAFPAGATNAGNAVGVGTMVAAQKALTSVMMGAAHREVAIPKKVECRSPYKPPEWAPQGPPPWANGKALGLQAQPPWKKWADTWKPAYKKAAKKGPKK